MSSIFTPNGVQFGRARVTTPAWPNEPTDRDYDDPAVVAANLEAALERARARLRLEKAAARKRRR